MNTQPKLRKSEQNRRLPPLGGFVQHHLCTMAVLQVIEILSLFAIFIQNG